MGKRGNYRKTWEIPGITGNQWTRAGSMSGIGYLKYVRNIWLTINMTRSIIGVEN